MKEKIIQTRNKIVENIKTVYRDKYNLGFLTGSLSGDNPDFLSDIDVWLVTDESSLDELMQNRLDHYNQVGEIAHICEPPHHSPLVGIASTVIYKNGDVLTEVDYCLISDKVAKFIENAKVLFGEVNIPDGFPENNKEKRELPETYRIDFFLMLLFIGVKKTYRNDKKYLDMLFNEYKKLSIDYDYENLSDIENNYDYQTLENYMRAIEQESTDKQKSFMDDIRNFIKLVKQSTFKIDMPKLGDEIGLAPMHIQSWKETYVTPESCLTEEMVDEKLGHMLTNTEFRKNTISESLENPSKVFYRVIRNNKNKIAGFFHGSKNEEFNELDGIYLLDEVKGSGISGKLMEEFLDWIDKSKPTRLEVFSFNERALNYYKKYGFVKTDKPVQIWKDILPYIEIIRPADEIEEIN
jgi:GNAT superfamily N-acetyltransferase